MKVSYNWLKKYIKTVISAERAAEILTETGLEVEGIEHLEAVKGNLEGVVIGEVIDLKLHEDADKLKVAEVNVGDEKPLQIVCGAPNIEKGQKVVVATVGTTLYPNPDEPFKIKKAKIRGVSSFGMICAEDEIGIGESHAGIMILDNSAKIGTPATQFFDLKNDIILEIGLTPNRTDAMGHIGVARDLKAFLNFHENQSLHTILPEVPLISDSKSSLKIKINNPDLCPDYRMIKIKGIQVKPSPEWLAQSLRSIGIQPKNNVVDVTNFVMHECGHPLHAFDQKVVQDNIIVRLAKKGEKLTTLDGQERELSESDLLIANAASPMCIAGVMGGENSGVKESTNEVCLESAFFNPTSVRKSAKRHGIHSDASFRFERGANPEILDWALRRATQLIIETAGGEIEGGIVVVNPQLYEPVTVHFHPERCRKLIGAAITNEQMGIIFDELGMLVTGESSDGDWLVKVPGFRAEVTREADLIEEVLRIYGVNNINLPEKMHITPTAKNGSTNTQLKERIANFLVGAGWSEIMNNSLTSSQYLEVRKDWKKNECVQIKNPLSQELDMMRPDLLMGGLESLSYNINRKNEHLKFFEIGTVYQKLDTQRFKEEKHLALWLTSDESMVSWKNLSNQDFYSLKNILENIGETTGLHLSFSAKDDFPFVKGVSISVNNKEIGKAGILHPDVLKSQGIKKEVFFGWMNWTYIAKKQRKLKISYNEVPKTLPVKRDYSVLIDQSIDFETIREAVYANQKGSLLKDIQLFDVYEGENLPKGKKSYALSFILQDDEKTLKDAVIDKKMQEIWGILEHKIGAELR